MNMMNLKGKFSLQHLDAAGNLIQEMEFPNGIVDEGLNHILETEFRSGTQISAWYIGLVSSTGFTAFANSDTLASHPGWTEDQNYSEATRPQWVPDAATGRAISNSSTTDFNMNATATVEGIFIASGNTKGGTTGVLWSTAGFASPVNANNGDVIKVTYSLQG